MSHPAAPPRSAEPELLLDVSPSWLVHTGRASRAIRVLREELPAAQIHYAYKACPISPIAQAVLRAGASFEVASLGELRAVVAEGADPAAVLFSNPIKSPSDVAAAHAMGLWRFCVDSEREVRKVADQAPGASVYVRLSVDNSASTFPLDRKFGTGVRESADLLVLARDLGLDPWGLTFHVGSHCPDPEAWASALRTAGEAVALAAGRGIHIRALDIGGGFPALRGDESRLSAIAAAIRAELIALPAVEVYVEPGRLIAADAVDLAATVIGRASRADGEWLYLDVGVFSGLMEARDARPEVLPAIRQLDPRPGPTASFTLAGPTCDQADCVATGIWLPADCDIGDRLLLAGAGAYGLSYVGAFCGVEPPAIAVAELATGG